MASNYTTNYELPLWEPQDSFLRTEFNEAHQKIDDALSGMATKTKLAEVENSISEKCEIVAGSYTGNGAASRTISLGFRPKAVFVCKNNGATMDTTNTAFKRHYGGLALDGFPLKQAGKTVLVVADGGFSVYLDQTNSSEHTLTNESGTIYHYLAFK